MPLLRENAQRYLQGLDHEAYADLVMKIFSELQEASAPTTRALDAAEAMWLAATDPSPPMRIRPVPMLCGNTCTDHLILYTLTGSTVHLLSIRHHRQLSFAFAKLWAP